MATAVAGGRLSTAKIRDLVAQIPFFARAPQDLLTAVSEAAAVVRLPAGAYFLQEGDSCDQFAVLVSGRMRVFKLAESGHEITLYHVGPGEACPLNVSCILSNRTVPAMAQVEEEVEALTIPASTFRRLIAEHESLRSFVFTMFAGRLTEVMSLVEEIAFRRMDERLARRLLEMLQPEDAAKNGVEITHAEVAADLGTAREVVSRLLKDFERQGAIQLSRGRIMLRNASLLQDLTSGGGS